MHTPGPWTALPISMAGTVHIKDKHDRCIIKVWDWPEAEANAALVAAAPDMLEALKIARAQLGALTDTYYDAGKAKIYAAIAKAEGPRAESGPLGAE